MARYISACVTDSVLNEFDTYNIGAMTAMPNCPSGMYRVVDLATFSAYQAPLDYAVMGSLFVLSFSSVVGLYLIARSAGVILEMIRRG